ncbi:MAG: ATP-dependent RNA helicase HrpA, partial [Desulfobacterales bacterium]
MSDPPTPIRRLLHLLPEARRQDRPRLRAALQRLAALPAAERASEIERLERRLTASIEDRRRRSGELPPLRYPPELPISAFRDEITAAIGRHRVVIVCGETGSGKSTQLPKFCLAAGRGTEGLIGHTQPRRIAAQAVARRIAEELGEEVGRTVGFKIRFHEQTSPATRIQVMTDGILLAEAAGDRDLSAYDTLIIDEAHERSLNIDFLLGYLRVLLRRRRNLKLIVTSATLDTEAFTRAFEGAPVIRVEGRTYPVEVRYRPPEPGPGGEEPTPVEQAVEAVRAIAAGGEPGDVLVFLPTEQDIREAAAAIEDERLPRTRILPLFARLSSEEQHRVFRPAPGRKVVLATNVAETSLTIPGIRFVVDTGLARIPRYLPRTRTTAMPVSPISRGSAEQRAGRCGRTQGGVCIRLYSEEDFLARPLHTPPEIRRSNLAEVVLRLLALRLGPIAEFPFLDPPDPRGVADGVRLLTELGAVEERDGQLRLTALGKTLARIPLDPRLSRMLVAGREEGCFAEASVIAAALSIRDPRERPVEKAAEADRAHAAFHRGGSDFLTLLALWDSWQEARRARPGASALREFCRRHHLSFRRMREWEDVHRQILEAAREAGLRPVDAEGRPRGRPDGTESAGRLHRAVLSGFLSHIAVRKEKNLYRTARGREAMIFPGSAAFGAGAEWIVAAEYVETARLYARTAAAIDPAWLERLGGALCRSSWRDPRFDPRRGEVTATEQVTLFGLPIVPGRPVSLSRIDLQAAARVFCREALVQGRIGRRFAFLEHNRAVLDRVAGLERRLRRRDLLVGEEELVGFYRERLGSVASVRDLERLIRERGGDGFLHLSWEAAMTFRPAVDADALFPESVTVAGRRLRLSYRYEPGGAEDGVTLEVPVSFAGAVPLDLPDWLVPGLLPEKIDALLKSLPKGYRKALLPLSDTRDLILREMPRGGGPLVEALSGFLRRRLGADALARSGVRLQPGGKLPHRGGVERGVGPVVALEAAHQPLPRRRRQQPGRVGDVAGAALAAVGRGHLGRQAHAVGQRRPRWQ